MVFHWSILHVYIYFGTKRCIEIYINRSTKTKYKIRDDYFDSALHPGIISIRKLWLKNKMYTSDDSSIGILKYYPSYRLFRVHNNDLSSTKNKKVKRLLEQKMIYTSYVLTSRKNILKFVFVSFSCVCSQHFSTIIRALCRQIFWKPNLVHWV